MPSFKKEEEKVSAVFSQDDIKEYRDESKKFSVKTFATSTLSPFEQFVVKKGVAKLDDKGTLIVTNVSEFDRWVGARNAVESSDSWHAQELRRLFPEEEAKYRSKFARLRDAIVALGIAKHA